jgi:hypothetical protein
MAERSDKTDVVVLAGPTEDGKGANVLRVRPGHLEAGEVRPLEHGKPIAGEVVRLKPREDAPAICNVEVLHEGPPRRSTKPPQVASTAYRKNWDAIFGAAEAEPSPESKKLAN